MRFDIPPEILVAVIAFIGVFITIITSYVTSKRTLRHEVAKLKSSIEQSFSTTILKERNERYPEVYSVISSLAKLVKAKQEKHNVSDEALDEKYLTKVLTDLNHLDSKHALFYTIETSYLMADLRDHIQRSISYLPGHGGVLSEVMLNKLRTAISVAEIGLKKDVGILIEENSSIRSTFMPYKDYKNPRA